MTALRLAYFADDFTGATDAMEFLSVAGVDTTLFTSTPTPAELAENFPHLEAIGVASLTRSASVTELNRDVPDILEKLRDLNAPIVHYKVCSTFDSSPEIGSIGRVAELGFEVFTPGYIPVLVGAPDLGRYVLFGNLFASDGTAIHRLDRHATMRDHPVTPMGEADLRRHLGAQTALQVGHVDLITVRRGPRAVRSAIEEQVRQGAELVVLDTFDAADLATLGRELWSSASDGAGFVIGSSGVESALTSYWKDQGELDPPDKTRFRIEPVDQLLVLSASAALQTARQIEWARDKGWAMIAIDCGRLLDDDVASSTVQHLVEQAAQAFGSGSNVVLYTALGPNDPSLEATRRRAAELGLDPGAVGNELGRRLGSFLIDLVGELRPQRVCVAGGDTSGHVVGEMGVTSLKMISATVPGAPLCKISAPDPILGALEIVLKGGQTGPPDYFEILRGGASRA